MTTSADLPAAPVWQGVSHLAFVTPDMDSTVRFYAGVLGMPLVTTLMAGPMRHYFFEIAPHNTIAFFEIEGAETFNKGAGSPGPYPVQFDHLSFNVADEAALETLRVRVAAAGSEVTDVVDHGVMKSVYFTDPNGIALEASYWIEDGTGRMYDPTNAALFSDPNPVPAVAELASGGLRSIPATKLV
jgi:catechol 2,3-dioxygenase-like lactoylglutathione lyase family enzyme